MKFDINNKKKLQIILFVLIAVITLGVGYAAITAINLVISGNSTASANQNNFKVVFKTANITTGTGTASIDQNDATQAYFDVSGLSTVGDTAVATYTIKNESNGVGAEIGLKVTNSNSEYFQVTERVEDNKLQAGDTTTATVTVQMIKTPIEENVSTSITGTLTASPLENDSAAGGSSESVEKPTKFEQDSWEEIRTNVRNGTVNRYNIGDTKTVEINGNNYTVRLVNKSSDSNCGNDDYSETACGFVVEFVDIITTMQMKNKYISTGGYPATFVYDYLKNTLYGQLPQDLQMSIKPTRVISGYGNNGYDSANFTTNDKLYLLSGVEILGEGYYDTAASTTTQLEYYSNNGVSFDRPNYIGTNLDKAIKQYQGNCQVYWLRSAASVYGGHFLVVNSNGCLSFEGTYYTDGVAPAFRIG